MNNNHATCPPATESCGKDQKDHKFSLQYCKAFYKYQVILEQTYVNLQGNRPKFWILTSGVASNIEWTENTTLSYTM